MKINLTDAVETVLFSESEKETIFIGEQLAGYLNRTDVVALRGELGTGKTRITQGICRAMDVVEPVLSPTFTIINQYTGRNSSSKRLTIFHIDCYRLETEDEILQLGLDELLYNDNICIIEWAEKCESLLTLPYWEVRLTLGNKETERNIVISRIQPAK